MKIVAILGSPHGMKGTTGTLLAGVTSAAKAAGAEVKAFELSKIMVKQGRLSLNCPCSDKIPTRIHSKNLTERAETRMGADSLDSLRVFRENPG